MTKYIFMVFAGACSYGMLSTFVKLAYREGYTAAGISLLQAAIGMVVLWIVVLISGKGKKINVGLTPILQRYRWLPVLLTGAAIGLTTFLYYLSVQYIDASLAVVLLMQFAWMGVLMNWLLYKQKPSRLQFLIIAMILGGTIMASGIFNTNDVVISIRGIVYALASAGLYAIYIVANGSVGQTMNTMEKSAIIMTGSAAGIFIVNVHDLILNTPFDLHILKWAAFLSLFGTIIPPVLFAKGIPKIGAGLSSLIMTVELPVAIVFAHFVLTEKTDLLQWIGIAIMVLALILLNLQKAKRFNN